MEIYHIYKKICLVCVTHILTWVDSTSIDSTENRSPLMFLSPQAQNIQRESLANVQTMTKAVNDKRQTKR